MGRSTRLPLIRYGPWPVDASPGRPEDEWLRGCIFVIAKVLAIGEEAKHIPEVRRGGTRMAAPYDLAVIGAGMGGVRAATEAAKLGARVALVERHKLGGT
jgi:NADPH-dependent 2,4-dienoyl-CoA reductase/sulfur reductase-like enzyme